MKTSKPKRSDEPRKQPPHRIIVTQRSGDWHACLEGQPGKWGCASTVTAAIGDLVITWQEFFGITIEKA